jgi:hypothetical protein
MSDTGSDEIDPTVQIDQTTRLLRVMHDGNDHRSKEFNRLFNDVKVTVMKRIKTARIQSRES